MKPKEKAKELVSLFTKFSLPDDEDGKWESWYLKRKKNAKECALIAVDEILNTGTLGSLLEEYYKEVKQEIINL